MSRAPRFRPPDGPRYELLDTSFALCWIALVSYVLFPVPTFSSRALGAPLEIVTEQQLGLGLAVLTALGCLAAYFRPRLVFFPRPSGWRVWRRATWRRDFVYVVPVRLGYQASRTASLYMCVNFAITAVLLAADLYLPDMIPLWHLSDVPLDWVHHIPPPPSDQERYTLRSSLIFAMLYGYAFRRLKRDNRVR